MTCSHCGAVTRAGAAWCGQCHAPFATAAAVGRWLPAAAPVTAPQVYSRWRGGPTTFGPLGRMSWTLMVLLVAAFAIFSGDIFFMGIWIVFAGPMILRSVWKRDRIR